MRAYLFLCLVLAGLGAVAAAACGSRTGLLVPEEPSEGEGGPADSGAKDATTDAEAGRPDASDAAEDEAAPPRDGPHPIDARSEEAAPPELDALPPIDVSPPVISSTCPDAGSTLIYVITAQYDLFSFFPPSQAFTPIGRLRCPALGTCLDNNGIPQTATPFSMGVNRQGIAFVLYCDGELFRVSTANAQCRRSPFTIGQHGFPPTFGMGFAGDSQGGGETLYVAGDEDPTTGIPPRLGAIDTTTFALRIVGAFVPPLNRAELTGTGAGDLFGFYAVGTNMLSSAIGQIDKTTGRLIGQSVLPGLDQGQGWAFAFWGGDFYTFTGPGGSTIVTRFHPSDGSVVTVARTPELIVGAGVSTCAPQQ
jgi:hypothetical protein